MTSPADLTGWVTRIYDQWGETGASVARGVSWFQNSLFKLNIALNTAYYMSGDYIVPDMTQMVSGIYEEMYYCYYRDKQVGTSLGAASWAWTEVSGEEQGTIRRASRTEVAKNYAAMTKACQDRLDELIEWYLRITSEGPIAAQVLYNDRGSVPDFGLMCYDAPPNRYYSYNNTVWGC